MAPAHQFPLGVQLRAERRTSAIGWAPETGGLVIEDDYDAELRYDRTPVGALQALDPERVVYIGTASKTLAPGLRIGWMVVPETLLEPLADLRARAHPTLTADRRPRPLEIDLTLFDRKLLSCERTAGRTPRRRTHHRVCRAPRTCCTTSSRLRRGRAPGAIQVFGGRCNPARPRCQSPREESNLCARGRNPLLFQLSYGGRRERPALPVVVITHARGFEVRMEGVEPSWPLDRRLLRPVRIPVPPHPHESRRLVLQSVRLVVHAAGRGGCRCGRAVSSRALRRASSWTTLAGRSTGLGRAATRTRWRCISASSLSRRALATPSAVQRAPRAKSEMSCGVAVSKPTTSSIPRSFGSAIEKPFETMPTTTSRASIPDAWR
jgi:hypothetical protein